MNDTSPVMEQKMRELIQKKSPTERIEMGCSMHATSRYLIIHAILRENPSISLQKLRQELFLRFYGEDFDEAQKEKILAYLALSDSDASGCAEVMKTL